ncbi:MAG: C45 family peptidase [Bifidobacteriaceae bacterium]|nr:C45 family peptidase [Bifidobacteriaceae bacterium]
MGQADAAEAFGAHFASLIQRAVREYRWLFDVLGLEPGTVRRLALEGLDALRDWAPDLAMEVQALARGAGLPVEDAAMLSARTEILAAASRGSGRECSTAVHLPADGSAPRTLQTWDWLDCVCGHAAVRHMASPGPGRLGLWMFTEMGQIGKVGVNSAGLGLHFNILNHESDSGLAGVPVHAVARRIVDTAEDLAAATEIAASARVAASTAMTVAVSARPGRAAGAVCLEVSPAKVEVLGLEKGGTLVHTNHFLSPSLACGDISPHLAESRERFTELVARADGVREPDSLRRVTALAGRDAGGCLTVMSGPDTPAEEFWVTKATVCLELDPPGLAFCEGGLAAASPQTWRRIPPASPV